ncbi:FAD-dependent oxidoreductase [Streptomyces indonesiensis]
MRLRAHRRDRCGHRAVPGGRVARGRPAGGCLGVGEQEFLDRDAVRAQVDSPTFLAGLWDRRGVAMLHPAKLAWGLARACAELGVRIYEHTPAARLASAGAAMAVRTPSAGCAPARWRSPPTPSPRWCAASARTSPPSTTTR